MKHLRLLTTTRRSILLVVLVLLGLLSVTLFVYPVSANLHYNTGRQSRSQSFSPQTLQQRIQSHQLASSVQVLAAEPPSVIIQFPLLPSGVKKAFPRATGVVTIVQGNPEVSLFDTVTVDVQNMPPDITFTIFFLELANKPFGHVQYVSDLHTRDDGSGDVTFQTITLVAFAADARNPGISKDQSGDASGIQLEHVGMWFDGVSTPSKSWMIPRSLAHHLMGAIQLHAGPQAMTDGQTLPVI